MTTINNKYHLGEVVYHKLNSQEERNLKGVVVSLKVSSPEFVEYIVVWEQEGMGSHSEYELFSENEYNLDNIL